MNRARPVAAVVLAVAGSALVVACGTNPYATSGAVRPAAAGVPQQLPVPRAVPAGSTAGQAQLVASTVDGLGPVLADAEGHTLYRYAKDGAGTAQVSCTGPCAETWPPLLSDVPPLTAGVDAQLVGLVTRPDGRKQVTVGGRPVYRYAKDTGPGIALGRDVSADWAVVTPAGEKPTTVGTTDVGGLGPVLTDREGHTLYLFTKDGKGSGKSTCDGDCARKWPPVLAGGRITVAESIDTGLIGQLRRADGTMQVTVGGWPVYTYAQDAAPGEANGHGAGGTWYAMEPSGCRVDPARRPSSGGY
ncbi:SCO0930 family lipoprotein [Amycolatopsis sp. NEAU-NG30]|uniref:SCO0930 family lipoprotein n=1 Tax=Amycolatopsis melonis TaxID=3156488 RepID=A0ABV0L7Z0_9PSEU